MAEVQQSYFQEKRYKNQKRRLMKMQSEVPKLTSSSNTNRQQHLSTINNCVMSTCFNEASSMVDALAKVGTNRV